MKNKPLNKREIILTTKQNTGKYITAVIVLVILLSCAGLYLFIDLSKRPGGNENNFKVKAEEVKTGDSDKEARYAVPVFSDGKARFFSYKTGGTEIRYFILKSSDDNIRAAFDACDVCWQEGKGYEQQGDAMICRNCGRSFPSVMINTVSGGCNPSPLKIKTDKDEIIIKKTDILAGRKYFSFKDGSI